MHKYCDKSLNESYTAICLPFLFHTSTIFQITISEFLGRFNDNFQVGQVKFSQKQLQRRFFINFISEKLCSADTVEMGIDKHMVASLCRLGNNAISMSLVSNSFSCMDISSFGYIIRSW